MSEEITDKLVQKRIRELASEYRERGYTVKVAPRPADVPSSLRGYTPDLVARSKTDKVLIEVKSRDSLGSRQLEAMVRHVERLRGWRLELVVTNPDPDLKKPGLASSAKMVRERLDEAEKLLMAGSPEAALLLGWASFEGLVRRWSEKEHSTERFVPISALTKLLFSRGLLSNADLKVLEHTRTLRDTIAHGAFTRRPLRVGLIGFFRVVLKLLLKLDQMQN
jgi:hypothetical protein